MSSGSSDGGLLVEMVRRGRLSERAVSLIECSFAANSQAHHVHASMRSIDG